MYYELIILSLLMQKPKHGYLIAKIINDIIGPYARISNGRLYPLLARLEESGLIQVCEDQQAERAGERPQRTYRVTDEGRKRFHHLMMDTTSSPGEYRKIFALKVQAMDCIEIAERLYLIQQYIAHCQTNILHQTAEIKDMECTTGLAGKQALIIETMRHSIDQWQLELDWAHHLYDTAMLQTSDTAVS